jgi:hypothetical protein
MLGPRMPPPSQRRNAAYLNRPACRFGAPGRDRGVRGTEAQTGLAIDLGSSLKRRFRLDHAGAAYLDGLPT